MKKILIAAIRIFSVLNGLLKASFSLKYLMYLKGDILK
jgi:hypothetical protein